MTTQMMRYMTVDEFYNYLEETAPAEKKEHVSLKAIISSFEETLTSRALFLGNTVPALA